MKTLFTLLRLALLFLVNVLHAQPTIEWQKCLGGTENDEGICVQQTIDGGFILTGYTFSNDGDVSGNHGGGDAWIVKLGSVGDLLWQKCIGGAKKDVGSSIKQASDGGYVFLGSSNSNNGDVNGNNGGSDIWVVKMNSTGDIQWQKCLGGTN